MKRSLIITVALLGLTACGTPQIIAQAEPASTTEAPATTATTDAPATTEAPECVNGARENRNVTATHYDIWSCMAGRWVSIGSKTIPATTIPATTTPTPITAPAPPVTTPKAGTRSNPMNGAALTATNLETYSITGLAPADWPTILLANQFNDPAPEGQFFAKVTYTATAKASVTTTLSYYDLECDLVGTKGKVYDDSYVSDSHDVLHLLSDQPDIIGGGTISGDVYYLVDNDDTGLLALCDDGTYVTPA